MNKANRHTVEGAACRAFWEAGVSRAGTFQAMNPREIARHHLERFVRIDSLSRAVSTFCLSGLTWVCSSGRYSFLFAVSGLQIKQSGCQWSSSSWKNLLGAQHLLLLNFKIRNTSLVFQCLGLADDVVIRMHLDQRAQFDGELPEGCWRNFDDFFVCAQGNTEWVYFCGHPKLSCLEVCS